eukprot:TRINITY_DN6044_c0_g1_i1.p1 TRINITY_DN6044_c0_g1~~TRINITY_DN6044_c0_g1_i1.p1  ORF type:complete len:732 (-),score=165.98 TRINITY_DN6044_c0_g1_i1:195-2390(-)
MSSYHPPSSVPTSILSSSIPTSSSQYSLSHLGCSNTTPAVPEALVRLWKETETRLHALWDEIGVPDSDRRKQLQQAHGDIVATCNATITHNSERVLALKDDINRHLTAIQNLLGVLGRTQFDVRDDIKHGLEVRLKYLQTRLDILEKERGEQYDKLHDLHSKLSAFWTNMDLIPDPQFAMDACVHDLSKTMIDAFKSEIVKLKRMQDERTDEMHRLCQLIIDLWEDMDFPTDAPLYEMLRNQNFDPTEAVLSELEEKLDELTNEKNKREDNLSKIRAKIELLQDRLQVDEDERQTFLHRHRGISSQTILANERELVRLCALKDEKIEHIIRYQRDVLAALWDKRGVPVSERLRFRPAHSNCFDDKTLDDIEEQIGRLEDECNSLVEILTLIHKRERILDVVEKLDSVDPSILGSKNRWDAKKVREQEKTRHRVNIALPLVEETLRARVGEWEENHKQTFLYNGYGFLEQMENDIKFQQQAKENEKLRRASEKFEKNYQDATWGTNKAGPAGRGRTQNRGENVRRGTMTPLRRTGPSKSAARSNDVSSICTPARRSTLQPAARGGASSVNRNLFGVAALPARRQSRAAAPSKKVPVTESRRLTRTPAKRSAAATHTPVSGAKRKAVASRTPRKTGLAGGVKKQRTTTTSTTTSTTKASSSSSSSSRSAVRMVAPKKAAAPLSVMRERTAVTPSASKNNAGGNTVRPSSPLAKTGGERASMRQNMFQNRTANH